MYKLKKLSDREKTRILKAILADLSHIDSELFTTFEYNTLKRIAVNPSRKNPKKELVILDH